MKFFKHYYAFVLCAVMVLLSTSAYAGQIQLSWKAPKTPPNFQKYRLYWGEKSGTYSQHKDVDKKQTSVTITNLDNKKTYYFVATTVMASGKESDHSGSSQSRHLSGLTSLHIFRPSQGQPGLANLIITIE